MGSLGETLKTAAALWCALGLLGAQAETNLDHFKSELRAKSLAYFLENSHPVSGLTRDRARNRGEERADNRIASLAATGFALAVMAQAVEQGELPREEAIKRTERALRFASEKLFRHHGWFYHFVDWETGERIGKNEVSTIDSALFMAGALAAASTLQSSEVSALAEKIYREMDFLDMMTDGGTKPESRTLTMGWDPETGYLLPRWETYAEHFLLLILGLGHPDKPLPAEVWTSFERQRDHTGILGGELPLFVHQYSQIFIDFSLIGDADEDILLNSTRASQLHRDLAYQQRNKSETYRAGLWGLSASDSITGYQAFSPEHSDGTVCPGCAGASAMFLGDSIVEEMKLWAEGPHRDKLWGKYGFNDSVNLDQGWSGDDAIGITVGALYLSLSNMGESRARFNRAFSKIPAIRRGLDRVRSARPAIADR